MSVLRSIRVAFSLCVFMCRFWGFSILLVWSSNSRTKVIGFTASKHNFIIAFTLQWRFSSFCVRAPSLLITFLKRDIETFASHLNVLKVSLIIMKTKFMLRCLPCFSSFRIINIWNLSIFTSTLADFMAKGMEFQWKLKWKKHRISAKFAGYYIPKYFIAFYTHTDRIYQIQMLAFFPILDIIDSI